MRSGILCFHDGPAVFTAIASIPFSFGFNPLKIRTSYSVHVKAFRARTLTKLVFFNGQVTMTAPKFHTVRFKQYKSLVPAI